MNILANLRSAFNKNQRRNVIALTAAAGIVAGVVGTATAVAPTASVPITHGGAVTIARDSLPLGFTHLFSVPVGKKFMLTDIIVANLITTPGSFKIYTAATSSCTGITELTANIVVPASNNVVIPLVSGIGNIGAGKPLCFQNADTEVLQVTIRGYLFT